MGAHHAGAAISASNGRDDGLRCKEIALESPATFYMRSIRAATGFFSLGVRPKSLGGSSSAGFDSDVEFHSYKYSHDTIVALMKHL